MGLACNDCHRLLRPFLSVSDRVEVGGEDRAAEKEGADIQKCPLCGEPMEVGVDEESELLGAPEQPLEGSSEPQHFDKVGKSCSVHGQA